LQSSNLSHLFAGTVGSVTYEGTADALVQQHARYLLKRLTSIADPQQEGPVAFLSRSDYYSNPKLRCSARSPADFGNFTVLVEAFEVRAARSVLKLAQLSQLFVVWLLVDGIGAFRHDDYVSSEQANMAHQQLTNLLPLVRRNAVRLTDAWDFSDFELNSTLGRFDGAIYTALVDHAKREPLSASQMPGTTSTFDRLSGLRCKPVDPRA
jgi:acyl-CoA oxidase